MRQFILSFLGILLAAHLTVQAASFGINRNGRLDQPAIAKAYKESDWDKVTQTLEDYLKRKGDSKVDLEERIFAYKYLGTIYAADTMTQTKSESYYNRLLALSPTVEIFDLYASNKINAFFDRVKRDFERSRNYSTKYDTYGHAQPSDNSNAPSHSSVGTKDTMPTFAAHPHDPQPISSNKGSSLESKSSNTWVWWTVGIAAAAGAGAGVYYMTTSEPKVVVRDLGSSTTAKP